MPKRIQSPSSINTFKQCPRKYFYQYIVKHKTSENIHCVRGNVVHETLERFYDYDISNTGPETYKQDLSFFLKSLFDACWNNAKNRLSKLGLSEEKLDFYKNESTHMLANWLNHLFKDIDKELKKNISLSVAFNKLQPIAKEKQYIDKELAVRGYIDAICQEGEHITLLDYKTSKAADFKPEYMLQLGIYAVLYEKEHGKYPDNVGIWLLKHGPQVIKVTPKLVKDALFEIEQIHAATESAIIMDYPKKKSPLCKYSTGQCDFYEICMKDK